MADHFADAAARHRHSASIPDAAVSLSRNSLSNPAQWYTISAVGFCADARSPAPRGLHRVPTRRRPRCERAVCYALVALPNRHRRFRLPKQNQAGIGVDSRRQAGTLICLIGRAPLICYGHPPFRTALTHCQHSRNDLPVFSPTIRLLADDQDGPEPKKTIDTHNARPRRSLPRCGCGHR
jgi:hypothetical protein